MSVYIYMLHEKAKKYGENHKSQITRNKNQQNNIVDKSHTHRHTTTYEHT